MNRSLLVGFSLAIGLSFLTFTSPLHAAKGDKKKERAAANKSENKAPERPRAALPSQKLEPLVVKQPAALQLLPGPDGKRGPVGQERAAMLRADFAAAKVNATPAERARYDAAIVVCDQMMSASKELVLAHAHMNASDAFHGNGKMGSTKKGPKGNDKFFAEGIKSDWKKRKEELLTQINNSFARLKIIEAQTKG